MAKNDWNTIAETLASKISSGELSDGSRLPSGEELATEWGVSRHTAHRALQELQRQGLVARHRRWGSVVSASKRPQMGKVAFIVDRFAQIYNFPQQDLIRGLNDGLGDDIHLIITECKGEPEQEARLLRQLEEDVDGIVIYPTTDPANTPLLQAIYDSGKPIVVLDRIPPDLQVEAVVSNNEEATYSAIRTLVERKHRRIGFFSFHKPEFSSVCERFEAYRQVMLEAGVENYMDYVRWFPVELDIKPELFVQSVYDAVFTLVHRSEPITALFCVQDMFAAASLTACDQMGKQIPEDLELATFNDWPPMLLRRPWQTHRIVQNSYEIGLTAAQIVAHRMAGHVGHSRIHRVSAALHMADAGLEPELAGGIGAPMTYTLKTNGG